MKKSTIFSLNWLDLINGLVMAVGSAVIALILPIITSPTWVFDWTTIWHTAVASAVIYLVKNYFSSSNGVIGGKEPIDVVASNTTASKP